jgi:KDO2-lipid IV(A) lauroyltransferase
MTLSARLAQQTGACVLLAWGERLSWGAWLSGPCAAVE